MKFGEMETKKMNNRYNKWVNDKPTTTSFERFPITLARNNWGSKPGLIRSKTYHMFYCHLI